MTGPEPAGTEPASVRFPAFGTTALLVVTAPATLPPATRLLRRVVADIDLACSRFRPDSELVALHARAGRAVPVSRTLLAAVEVALRAARCSDGLVDPTVGRAVVEMGYDRDLAEVLVAPGPAPAVRTPAPGWWRVTTDATAGTVLLPRGVRLDLGATAKAYAADLAAERIARELGTGVLVSLGGDLRVAGAEPAGGWRVRVCEDHDAPEDLPAPVVTIRSGGLATSGTGRRAWRQAGRAVYHVVDPRTGDLPEPAWRAVSVAAATCVDANTASTAGVVLGRGAPGWLDARALPARLVAVDGAVTTVAGWPADARAAA